MNASRTIALIALIAFAAGCGGDGSSEPPIPWGQGGAGGSSDAGIAPTSGNAYNQPSYTYPTYTTQMASADAGTPLNPSANSSYVVRLDRLEGGIESIVLCEFYDWKTVFVFLPLSTFKFVGLAKVVDAARKVRLIRLGLLAGRFGLAVGELFNCDIKVGVSVAGQTTVSPPLTTDNPNLVLLSGLTGAQLIGQTLTVNLFDKDFFTDMQIGTCAGKITEAHLTNNGMELDCIFGGPQWFEDLMSSDAVADVYQQSGLMPSMTVAKVWLSFRP